LGEGRRLVMETRNRKGRLMADDESLLTNPPTQDVAVHVNDYVRFTKLLKWGAVLCLLTGFIVLLIL